MVLDDPWIQTLHSSIGRKIYKQLGSTTNVLMNVSINKGPHSIAENGEIVTFNSKTFYAVLDQDLGLKFTTKILPLKRKTYIFSFLCQLLNFSLSITNIMFVHKKFY